MINLLNNNLIRMLRTLVKELKKKKKAFNEKWKPDICNSLSANFASCLLQSHQQPYNCVLVFSWRLLQDCLPSRTQLLKRGVSLNVHEQSCVFCFLQQEDSNHLFLSCNFSSQVIGMVF